jgi:hypothetical protein
MKGNREWAVLVIGLCMILAPAASGEEAEDSSAGQSVQEVSGEESAKEVLLDEEGRTIAERDADGTLTRYWYDSDGTPHVVDE